MKLNKKKKGLIIVSALAVVGIGSSVFLSSTSSPSVEISSADENTYKISRMNLDESINLIAKAVADDKHNVLSELDAPIKDINVCNGDRVKAGDIICSFDVSELVRQRDNYNNLLSEYNKMNELGNENYNNNIALTEKLINKQLEQLDSTIKTLQEQYNTEVQNVSIYKNNYDSATFDADNVRSELDAVTFEIESIEAIINEYEQQMLATQHSETNIETTNISTDTVSSDFIESVATESTVTNVSEPEMTTPELTEPTEPPYDIDYYKELQIKKEKYIVLYNLVINKKNICEQKYNDSKSAIELLNENIQKYNREYDLLKIQKDHNSNLTAEEYAYSLSSEDINSSYAQKIEELNLKIENSVIIAPKDGIITDINVNAGDYIVIGYPICKIQSPEKIHFESYVTPQSISKITLDSQLQVSLDTINANQINGDIIEVSDSFDSEKTGYLLSFVFDGINEMGIYPGFEASAKIIINQREDILAVPFDSIFQKGEKYYIRKIEQDDLFTDIEIKKGLATNYYIEIISDQVKENDIIATGMLE